VLVALVITRPWARASLLIDADLGGLKLQVLHRPRAAECQLQCGSPVMDRPEDSANTPNMAVFRSARLPTRDAVIHVSP
jgi:hypothetical protein